MEASIARTCLKCLPLTPGTKVSAWGADARPEGETKMFLVTRFRIPSGGHDLLKG